MTKVFCDAPGGQTKPNWKHMLLRIALLIWLISFWITVCGLIWPVKAESLPVIGQTYAEGAYTWIGQSYPEQIENSMEFYTEQAAYAREQKEKSEKVKARSKTGQKQVKSIGEYPEDVEYLARTIWAEARGESAEGQLAVAEIILNRANLYGISIKAVVTAKNQFAVGSKYTDTQIEIAQRALAGERIFGDSTILYFKMGDDKSWYDFEWVDKIGCHSFYRA